MNILICGICGKMGKELCSDLIKFGHKIICGIDKIKDEKKNIFCDFNLPQKLIDRIDVVVDFANAEIINDEIEFCIRYNKKLAIFSTGHTKLQNDKILLASKKIPIFMSSNTSFGIALLNKIIKENLTNFDDYDISIIEEHHKQKKDIPSGTAKSFINIFKNRDIEPDCVSVRVGNIIGKHTILFAGSNEQIELVHTAYSRSLFSFGAIKILNYFNKQKDIKLYTMEDIFKK